MGWLKKVAKTVAKPVAKVASYGALGDNFRGTGRNILGGKQGISANIFNGRKNPDGTPYVPTEQDINMSNIWGNLSSTEKN